jgi:hypothetical protein
MHRFVKSGVLSFVVAVAASAAPVTFNFTNTAGSFAGSNSGGTCSTANGGYCANGDVYAHHRLNELHEFGRLS